MINIKRFLPELVAFGVVIGVAVVTISWLWFGSCTVWWR